MAFFHLFVFLFIDTSLIESGAFKDLGVQQASSVLNMLFGYYNWLRELISTFARETKAEIQVYVLRRLQAACDVRATLTRLLAITKFMYEPPTVLATATTTYQPGCSGAGSASVNSTQNSEISSTAQKSQKSATQAKTSQVNSHVMNVLSRGSIAEMQKHKFIDSAVSFV